MMSALIALRMLREPSAPGIGHVDNDLATGLSTRTGRPRVPRSRRGATQLQLGAVLRWLVVFGATAAIRRHGGTPADYLGLAAASAASWVGVPGPGESVLIAAGVLAAKHKLDLATVLAVAWAAATLGGIAGWLIGRHAGRTMMTVRRPLHHFRLGAVKRGDEVFTRHPVAAILLTPSWIAGMHRGHPWIYQAINAVSAAAWALGIGLAAYYVGPSVIEFVDDVGVFTTGLLVLLIAAVVVIELRRRKRRRPRQAVLGAAPELPPTPPEPSPEPEP
jgi:membrane protein DedA with SNARE-associated domain